MSYSLLCLIGVIAMASATTYYKETFDSLDNWVASNAKSDEGKNGKFVLSAGKFFADADKDKGMQTSQDARFYFTSSKIEPEFSNEGKDLVVQFSVKHEQNIDCGGGYIKIFPAGLDQATFNGDTDYNIMFGPDICGNTKRVHVIFNYKGENKLIKETIACKSDELTHVYTLILKSDNTYEVRIDGEKKSDGKLEDQWDMLAPKEIKDPAESKPADWVDEEMIDDPEDVKPAGYDDILEFIADPDAEKPDDWDEEDDGEWDAPEIQNPEYEGEWYAKQIDNPDYKGQWEHPMIANPDFEADDNLYLFKSNAFVGFDLWQVKSGTIFDNIIVTDSVEEAEQFMADTFDATKAGEAKAKEEQEAADRVEAEAASEAASDDDEDDYEDEDDEADHDEL